MQNATGAAAVDMSDETVADRIRKAREALDWSQTDLASRMGVTEETVTNWESGEQDPRSNRLVILAGILQVSAHWLLDGTVMNSPDCAPDPGESARAQLSSIRMKLREMEHLLNDLETQLGEV